MNDQTPNPGENPSSQLSCPALNEPRWYPWACFLLTLTAIQLALGPKIQLSQWNLQASSNAGVAEGVAWLHGRLDIPTPRGDPIHDRMHDTAYYKGKVYNVFPPLMGFLTVALAPLHKLLLPDRPDFWLPWPYLALIFWPLPITAFLVLRRQARDSAWAGLLTLYLLGGTAVLPNLNYCVGGNLAQINHVVSQVGLLIFVGDMLGRRRVWPSLFGLMLSTWTRQLTLLYALPLLWVAAKQRRLGLCIAGLVVIVAPLMTLNDLKFGRPWDFGYRYIYVGRESDFLAQRCLQYGQFSTHFIPENAYYMHLAPPQIQLALTEVKISESSTMGTSMWITTPILIFVLIAARSWLRDPRRRMLMLATLPVMFGLLCYHGPGFLQRGYNRFALDFIPIWLAVIAGQTRGGWRTWLTLACAAWSLLYFQAIVPNV